MFEWLFKYPPTAFLHGQLVLRSAWPRWPLLLAILGVGLGLAWVLRDRHAADTQASSRWRLPLIWLTQWSMAALILLLLWRPAIAVSELVPQANRGEGFRISSTVRNRVVDCLPVDRRTRSANWRGNIGE